ncbi:hypothetical protein C8F04DRAFT_1194018 [Mycena alexandri]|uniref:Fungal calcium binding protein domain-containing protein n=1 Tax=Mycena alexandri TaxID=1745969 RepID=A0AAD6S499_9AGAR|nr:hypothetical protein C8F04DRAFT_1196890 [Mycena alexandri]KAJ7022981.1 hypothetical protein C8F04DRAFT_1194018 [Mycena alexandri]
MQFSLVAFFAVLATGVTAAPAALFLRQDACDIKSCVIALAGTVVSCGTAAAQLGADPFSDAGCLFAAVKTTTEFPPSCDGCLEQFGVNVPGAVSTAESAVEGAAESVGSAISGLF